MKAKTWEEWWNDPEIIEGLDGYNNEECSQEAWRAAIRSVSTPELAIALLKKAIIESKGELTRNEVLKMISGLIDDW